MSQYTPICTDKMDEQVLADLENVKAEKLKVMEKIHKYNENFPDIDKWLNEYHEECTEYIKATSKQVNELVSHWIKLV